MLVAGCEKFFFPMVEAKKESKKDVEELLNRMVFVAGPALAAWPGIRETPGWQSHAKILQGNLYSASAREALVATLADSDCAQPRAHLDPRTVEVVLGLLSWDPAKRTTASQAMESFLFPGRAEAGSAPMQPGGGQSSTLASPLDNHSPSQASPHQPLPGSGATSASGSLAGGSGGTSAQKRAASKPEISPKRRCLEAQASADTPQSLKNSEGCLCSGQCSRKACDKARGSGKVKGHICERARDTCVPGSQACSECRCEIDGCPKLRTRLAGASGRFCSKHCKLDQVSQHEYTTRDGRKLKYPHAWDLALKCAAKVNFWERILGLPDDGAQAPS